MNEPSSMPALARTDGAPRTAGDQPASARSGRIRTVVVAVTVLAAAIVLLVAVTFTLRSDATPWR